MKPSFAFVRSPVWDKAAPDVRDGFHGLVEIIGDRVAEHDRHGREHVADGPRRELVRLAMEDDDIAHVGWPHGGECDPPDQRYDVLAQPDLAGCRVLGPLRDDVELLLDP